MTTDVSLNGVVGDLSTETVTLDLSDFAEEPGGAWKPGWYSADIIEGYQTAKGKQFDTADNASKNGDSRNVRLCLKVSNGTDTRTMQETFNYRTSDFGAERLEYIKSLRVENKDNKHWPDKDAQRSSMAVAKLGQIGKATGFGLKISSAGAVIPAVFVGQKVDVRLGIDENGYNIITAFAPAGTKLPKGQRP